MPCYFPLQARFNLRADGKRDIKFDPSLAKLFYAGIPIKCENSMSIPCGYCLGCRLEKSRQWALRCVHEASMYKRNCFITVTFAPEHLPKDGSLDVEVMKAFNKRLRDFSIPKEIRNGRKNADLRKFYVKENPVRIFYCGEYGDEKGRPHYHSLVFNFDFDDKVYWKTVKGHKYFISEDLTRLWGFGHCTIGEVTFDSAAYVARYALQKVYGDKAKEHYQRLYPDTGEVYFLKPEFAVPSRRPGLGKAWFDKWGESDVIPHDCVVSRGVKCKLPRYYDTLWERKDPISFAKAKEARRLKAAEESEHGTFKRLQARMKCQEARVKLLIREMEG